MISVELFLIQSVVASVKKEEPFAPFINIK